jgi:putative tryptophan/tyrosine transport system substrate-binding protein
MTGVEAAEGQHHDGCYAGSINSGELCTFKAQVEVGGLLSYGPDLTANFHRAASYVDKILRGAKPADLPVERPTKFESAINLKTAKALALTVRPPLLLRTDEVIQ